ncbi:class I SAM-dependent methyltransferase [Kitasatospora sp. NPDC006697]|uniref:class I SAM-dependent methyltransferase n=1 Tax=Kitasatospora sp. NPDC006697 TaxID=3364020 RepID=UPI0036A0353D
MVEGQREHWERTYGEHPGMYGEEPSEPALRAAEVFGAAGARELLELGAGHGRDALHFARRGFTVTAADFSPGGLAQLAGAARAQGVADRVRTLLHDVRAPLPLPDGSVDGVFAHMLLCMALGTGELRALTAEVRRVLRPGGTFVYTVRHTGDAHFGAGTDHGDDVWEHGGFAVHFFSRELVDTLAEGWTLHEVRPFEEGALPRRLWQVTQSPS